ncbi:MAG: glycosyltransferase family 39 protein [Anaerolineae bacterium]|nr:glycosyltransferase family 39 protein [Anaerolineae bacterium]
MTGRARSIVARLASLREGLTLTGLTLIGLLLRLFRLPTVPLGAHGDIAWKGLNALDWLQHGIWPYYVYELYAPEPVNVYLMGFWYAVTGQVSFFTSRLSTTIASTLVIPLIYLAVRLLAGAERRDDPSVRRAAWLASLAYTVSFYPIMLSKTGQRAQLFPLLVILLLACFTHGWQSGKWRSFIAAGVVMALANYTYIPARLMPLMVIAWAAYGFFAERERFRVRFRQVVAMGTLSLILVLPQIVTYIQTPEAFFARSSQTAGQFIFQGGAGDAGRWLILLQKIGWEFGIYLLPWRGMYAEMGRPLLGIPLAVGFGVALIAALWRLGEKALWWPLIGIPLMFVTDILSGTELQPHGLRMIGTLPLVFMLAAAGLALGWGWLEAHLPRLPSALWGGLAAGVILVPGLLNLWMYHFVYVPALRADPSTVNALEAADQFIADLILEHSNDGQPILITLDDFQRANIPFLLADEYQVRRSGIRITGGAVSLPEWRSPVLVVVPADPYRPRHDGRIPEHDWRSWVMLLDGEILLMPPAREDIRPYFEPGGPVDTVEGWAGQEVASLYRAVMPEDIFDLRIQPSRANFGGEVELYGYQVDSTDLTPGGPLWVTLYWRATERGASEDYETFAQIWDTRGEVAAKLHRWTLDGVYRTRLWRPDELVPTRFILQPAADAAPGAYTLVAGLYRVLANEPVPVIDAAGQPVVAQAELATLRIPLPIAPPRNPAPTPAITFGDSIQLAGMAYHMENRTLFLDLDWQARRVPGGAYTLFLHVLAEDGAIVAQFDQPPLAGRYPTTIWQADEVIPEAYSIPLEGVPSGVYAVCAGWYDPLTGRRLPALSGDEPVPDNRVELFSLTLP